MQNETQLNIRDSVEKLQKLNLISKETIRYLNSNDRWGWYNSSYTNNLTIADIVYSPKQYLFCIGYNTKSVREIVSFIDTYPIQGRIVPAKKDIARVIRKARVVNTIHDDRYDIIYDYYLTDMSVSDICKHLHCNIDVIHECIDAILQRISQTAYDDGDWGLLDLITISSMLDLYAARSGTYDDNGYCLAYIAGTIRDILLGKE